jgi:hypothetical protein
MDPYVGQSPVRASKELIQASRRLLQRVDDKIRTSRVLIRLGLREIEMHRASFSPPPHSMHHNPADFRASRGTLHFLNHLLSDHRICDGPVHRPLTIPQRPPTLTAWNFLMTDAPPYPHSLS